ncbi:T-cell immunoglobulin and mucin domain-containing protein 4-like [Pithys albifrons albifrons]|uniref:T-cell immunoglobulin and mucin domain-containing protein 4-like n=1 Tax=Pithys albifrons albifrons TaxID=3385563 RepID=UPI003A5CDF72
MSHFVLFHWILIQIFIAHTASQTVVKGVIGQPVKLPCNYQVTQHIYDICWGRGFCPNSKCKNKILETHGSMVTSRKSQRYDLQGSVFSGDVSLTIGMVEAEDAGVYCCRVEVPGWFNDIKQNIWLEVARATPVMTTTTRQAPVSSKGFRKTTFAPQATSGLQPTAQTAVLLTTTTTESTAVTTLETTAPPTIAVTARDDFPVTMVTTSALPDFPTMSKEDDVFCFTESDPLPGSTEVTTEFPHTLLAEEGSTSADVSVMMEEVPNTGVSANSDGKAEKHDDSRDKFPSSVILIACVIAGAVLFVLMFSLFWKRKLAKKLIMKSVGPPEEPEKVFSGAEGENNIFSL